MLLQDSLGGDAKALMIANLAPSAAHAVETLSSLNFAAKVGHCGMLSVCLHGCSAHCVMRLTAGDMQVANVVLKTPQRKFEEGALALASLLRLRRSRPLDMTKPTRLNEAVLPTGSVGPSA